MRSTESLLRRRLPLGFLERGKDGPGPDINDFDAESGEGVDVKILLLRVPSVVIAFCSVLCLAGSAFAVPVPISQSAFSGSETVIDFNTVAPFTPITLQYQANGVTFSGGLFAGFPLVGTAQNFAPFSTIVNTITVDFSSTMLRAGFDVLTNNEDDLLVEVWAFDNGNLVKNGELLFSTGSSFTFQGLEDTQGIDRLVMSAVGGGTRGFIMDNFRFEPVPEPSSAALLAGGLLLLAGSRMRRNRRELQ